MNVKCVLCDKIEKIDPDSLMGKKLRNHPLSTYMCQSCQQQISDKTNKRWEGKGKRESSIIHTGEEKW